MSNSFSKEERVAFEDLLEGFQDALVLSKLVNKYRMSDVEAERSNNTIWRPMPYIATSYDGMDQTGNFKDKTQLSVPATIGYKKSSPWILDAQELRDQLQENRLGDAAKQKLASDINVAVTKVASLQGTLVVKRTGAATGFDDVALADAIMNEQGIPMNDRRIALATRDYNSMAGDLAKRQNVVGKVQTAYDRAYIGDVAGFDAFKLDYSERLGAATATGVTIGAANQFYVPKATSTAATGEVGNVDNRYQTITVAVTGGALKEGDAFTITGVESVHQITKQATGQLKTFRIVKVNSPTSVVISPPIISAQGGSEAEKQYQNVSATPANGAVITMLNTATAFANPFWHRDAIELIPARYAVPTNAGAAVLRATTDQGIELVFQKQYDINTMKTKYRLDTMFGVVMVNPEMAGIELFNQT
ncbi:P22 phage major capsid protein family protein [Acinetobacter baumannii]|uniref:P22 phage major capsid protein family protein n=3 Tax=Acinetobacter baumannii TaxID=470 RepID=UPI00280EAFB8|nr:P22 phage major capsid protein family protein [Acinetobacter baumannii]MDQ9112784.1 P22 phage major capsid protein family protein [Acinetobacter baumannii]MDT7992857.1 P22 phage major capsid protein family protein [Acinetobacter baumannii]MDW7583771.1 P22 phage major capsid protein family protein [Acinetobacter baumannii]MEA3644561.1 P22 phage major capsid protein family protein [Acinetobacter baumannii]